MSEPNEGADDTESQIMNVLNKRTELYANKFSSDDAIHTVAGVINDNALHVFGAINSVKCFEIKTITFPEAFIKIKDSRVPGTPVGQKKKWRERDRGSFSFIRFVFLFSS